MTQVLQITDGNETVNLYNDSGLYVRRRGYLPQGGRQDENGDWVDLTETVNCWLNQTTDDDRAGDLQKLGRLAMKARRYWREQRVGDEVWIEASTDTETNTRYSVLKDLVIPQLDGNHYSGTRKVRISMQWTREGVWRGVAPNGTPLALSSLSGTVHNRDDVDGVNYLITSALTDVPGDVPALAKFQIKGDTAAQLSSRFRLAMSTADTLAELSSVSTHFNASDEGDSTTADANAPDNERLDHTVAGSGQKLYSWNLPDDLANYEGTYLVFAVARATVANTVSIRFEREGLVGDYVTLESGDYNEHYLGRFTLPSRPLLPGVVLDSTYTIGVKLLFTGAATSRFWNLFIVPVDNGFFQADTYAGSDKNTMVDGIVEASASLLHSNDKLYTLFPPVSTRGNYLQLPPNKFVRLDYSASTAGVVSAGETFDITTTIVPRFSTLRGDV